MDAWLERMYARHGPRYVVAGAAAVFGLCLFVLLPLIAVVPARYEGMSVAETLGMIGIVDASLVLIIALAVVRTRRHFGLLLNWSAGGDADRGAVRTAAYALPRDLAVTGALGGVIIGVPASTVALTFGSGHTTTLDLIEVATGATAALATGLLGCYLLTELTLLPVRTSLGRQTTLQGPSTGLTSKLMFAILAVTLIAATAGGMWAADREADGAGGLLAAMATGLVVTAGLALILLPLITGSLVGPIRQLTGATRAVGRGDLATSAAVTTTDELGELAASFNQMVDGLREREALRGEKDRLLDELRASRARIVAASTQARRKVERDLHDGAQQSLMLLNLKLGLAKRKLADDPAAAALMLGEARDDLDRALAELRDLAHGIYPAVLTNDGLPAALAEAAEQAAIPTTVDSNGTARYEPEIEAAVYFCCLEALQNAAKHAGQQAAATVRIEQRDSELRFEVTDDGVGFDPAVANGSAGLQNMADRIGALGGRLRVTSTPGLGTKVAGTVPVTPGQAPPK